jgi:hypothetical protein
MAQAENKTPPHLGAVNLADHSADFRVGLLPDRPGWVKLVEMWGWMNGA